MLLIYPTMMKLDSYTLPKDLKNINHVTHSLSFANLCSVGMGLKFYTSVAKGLKLKARKFLELILTFIEVTGEKLVGLGLDSHKVTPIKLLNPLVPWFC